jgi:hypothetical protein
MTLGRFPARVSRRLSHQRRRRGPEHQHACTQRGQALVGDLVFNALRQPQAHGLVTRADVLK